MIITFYLFKITNYKYKNIYNSISAYGVGGHKHLAEIDQEFEKIPNIENNREKYDILSWTLRPGDLIAFNFSTVHGAPANNSNNIRRAFSARFTGDDATYCKRKGETSPPFPEVKLKNGDKMDSPTFPRIL